MSEDKLYEVVKFYEGGREPTVIEQDLTLEEAKRLVNLPETSGGEEGKRWFWGFRAQE